MQYESRSYDEIEINLHQYVGTLMKRKRTFFSVFFLVIMFGFAYLWLSPRMYQVSMLVQAPTLETDLPNPAINLTDKNDLETAENIKFLILSNFFNVTLAKEMNLNLGASDLIFSAEIPQKTNVLKISTTIDENRKDLGIALLKKLGDLISGHYAKKVDSKIMMIVDQVKQNERAIENAKERVGNVKSQITELTLRREKLAEEIKSIAANTSEMMLKRDELVKEKNTADNITVFFLSNIIQTNLTNSSQLNGQLSDLSIRIMALELEIKTINSQISDLQMTVNKLNINKNFISNLRIIEQPKVSSKPISPDRKKILALSIFMGLFLGVAAVFAQEFWQNEAEAKVRK